MIPLHILIVEENETIVTFLQDILSMNDYKVTVAKNGSEALQLVTSHCPDLILLDIELPDINGKEIITEVRKWASIPIIIISANTDEEDKVSALDLGADDYITKPFNTNEMLARIRTIIRRNTTERAAAGYSYDGLTIDYGKRTVAVNGEVIHMTQNEYKIIVYLSQNAGRVIDYSELIMNIWGPNSSGDNKILRVNMANIRKKIEPDQHCPKYILTVAGVGYRMHESN